jgi:hypothetical protein
VSIRLVLEHGKERLQRLFHGAHNSHVHSGTTANLFATQIDLDDLCVRWIELLVWKVAAEHQQRLTVHHGVIAGGEPEESGHPDVVGIVVLDEFLSAQCVDDRSLQPSRDPEQLRACSGAARAAQNGDGPCAVQRFRGLLQGLCGGQRR